jgi:hypothetical protein
VDWIIQLGMFVGTFIVLRHLHKKQEAKKAERKRLEQVVSPACSQCSSRDLVVHRGEYVCLNCEWQGTVDP